MIVFCLEWFFFTDFRIKDNVGHIWIKNIFDKRRSLKMLETQLKKVALSQHSAWFSFMDIILLFSNLVENSEE